jgi:hypothetical protein
MYELIDVIEFLYSLVLGILLNFIIIELLFILCMMCDDWALHQDCLYIYVL